MESNILTSGFTNGFTKEFAEKLNKLITNLDKSMFLAFYYSHLVQISGL